MRDNWQDQIAYYVAGTLTAEEASVFEQHLATCEQCQQALSEWTIIAQAVVDRAQLWGMNPPPLSFPSLSVDSSLTHDVAGYERPRQSLSLLKLPPRTRKFRRQPELIVGFVAATTLLLLAVGMLSYVLLTTDRDRAHDVLMLLTVESTTTALAATALPFDVDMQQGAGDLGILPVSTFTPLPSPSMFVQPPLPSPTHMIVPAPSATVLPPSVVTPLPTPDISLLPETAALVPAASPTFDDGTCRITSATGSPVAVFREPDVMSDTVHELIPGEFLYVWVGGDAMWRLAGWAQGGLAGWVLAAEIQYAGDCDAFLTPTPTITLSTVCTVIQVIDGTTYAGPGYTYSVLPEAAVQSNATVLGLSDNDWVRLRYVTADDIVWVGWLPPDDIRISVACQSQPRIESGGFLPEPTPRILTPTAQPRIPVPSVSPAGDS